MVPHWSLAFSALQSPLGTKGHGIQWSLRVPADQGTLLVGGQGPKKPAHREACKLALIHRFSPEPAPAQVASTPGQHPPSASPTKAWQKGHCPLLKCHPRVWTRWGDVHYWAICLSVIKGRVSHLHKFTPKMSGRASFLKTLKGGHYHH